jgi:nucleoside-diphosphate kinase
VPQPDGVQRQLVGEVISRFERKGYKLVAVKMLHVSKAHAEKHYGAPPLPRPPVRAC